jgi:hypothetical protein
MILSSGQGTSGLKGAASFSTRAVAGSALALMRATSSAVNGPESLNAGQASASVSPQTAYGPSSPRARTDGAAARARAATRARRRMVGGERWGWCGG